MPLFIKVVIITSIIIAASILVAMMMQVIRTAMSQALAIDATLPPHDDGGEEWEGE